MDIITLIGPRCSGKSTIAKHLATSLGWKLIDLDQYMEKILESDGGLFGYAEKYGWDKYMTRLHQELIPLLASLKDQKIILDCGGGTLSSEYPESKLNAELLKKNSKVFLILPHEEDEPGIKILFDREKKRKEERDFWKGYDDTRLFDKVRKDYFERLPGMKDCAHEIIISAQETPKQLAERIERLILNS